MSNRKKLLLVGGGYADIPLIKSAQKLGLYVITSGNRQEDLGHKLSDEYCPADFSDPEAILEIAREKQVDYICPCANDFSALSAAYAAEKLGLPGHDSFETCKIIHHKDSYRSFAQDNSIPTPRALGFSDEESAQTSAVEFNLPIIIKPVDLTGGKGITRIDRKEDINQAISDAFSISKAKRIIVEEFVEGSRHGFSAMIKDGKVIFYFADDEHYYQNPYMVSGASTPTSAPESAIDNLISQIEKISTRLSLKPGIFHVQYILHEEQPVIIEICRRPPGDLYIKLVEYATGVDYPRWIVDSFCGQDCSDFSHTDVNSFFLRHCIMPERNGTLTDIEFRKEIENNVFDKFMLEDAELKVDNFLVQKFGIVFLKFESLEEMKLKSEQMQELIKAKLQ